MISNFHSATSEMISVAPDNLSILEYSGSIIEERCYQLSCHARPKFLRQPSGALVMELEIDTGPENDSNEKKSIILNIIGHVTELPANRLKKLHGTLVSN